MHNITKVALADDTLIIRKSDGRAIQLDMPRYSWLNWLRNATSEQRLRWSIVPSGGGVWWSELDEGIELQPLLDMQHLP